jgi:hypothetical protein
MKTKYLPLTAALLIGISGAAGASIPASIENSIADAHAAAISRIIAIDNINRIGIGNGIAAPQAIARIILAHDSIAIANIIESRIEGRQIEAGITAIAA